MIPYKRYCRAGEVEVVPLLKKLVNSYNQLEAQMYRFAKLVKRDVITINKKLDELNAKIEGEQEPILK